MRKRFPRKIFAKQRAFRSKPSAVGKTDPPASLIPTIAAYFGITSDFLLTGKDECNQADLELNDTSTQQLLKYFSSLSEVEKNIVLGKAAEFYLKSLSED